MKLVMLACYLCGAQRGLYRARRLEVQQSILLDEGVIQTRRCAEQSLGAERPPQQAPRCEIFESFSQTEGGGSRVRISSGQPEDAAIEPENVRKRDDQKEQSQR